jgi:oxygen-independent coproporphyrinogen-3 oxidase
VSSPAGFGLYLHVPFCRHRCDYCAFATWTDRLALAGRYLAACRTQVERAVTDGMGPVTSVFVGGGTPTLAPVDGLLSVLAAIPLAPGAEVSVEANPDDVTPELLRAYVDGGVNRLSLGVQSMVPPVLATLGRTHDPANVRRAAEAAHGVGLPFNVDLIYGVAGETVEQWTTTLDEALALEPSHVSAYGLTVEPGTPLAADEARHPDDDDQADKYLLATERLGAAGFEWYEISNWSKPGHRCRHNQLYWSQGDYLGVGCAAHSHQAGRRWWNLRTPERYVDAVEQGLSVEAGAEELDPTRRQFEAWELALRTTEGVPADAFEPGALDELAPLLDERPDGTVALTVSGRLLANEVAVHLRS